MSNGVWSSITHHNQQSKRFWVYSDIKQKTTSVYLWEAGNSKRLCLKKTQQDRNFCQFNNNLIIEHFTTRIEALSIWFVSLFSGCKNWPQTHGFHTIWTCGSLQYAHKRSSQYNERNSTWTSIFISTKTCLLKGTYLPCITLTYITFPVNESNAAQSFQ